MFCVESYKVDSNICWWPDLFSPRKQCVASEERRSFIEQFQAADVEKTRGEFAQQPLLSQCWMKTDELSHHHNGHGFTSHIT